MCHKKCQNCDDFSEFDVFLRMIPDQPGIISRLKKQQFDAKNDDFEIKNSPSAPPTEARELEFLFENHRFLCQNAVFLI